MSKAFFDSYNGLADIQRREAADAQAAQQNALAKRAGGFMASGDYSGAQNALYRGGDLDAGMKVAGAGEAQKKREAEGLARFTEGVGRMMEAGADPHQAWAAGEQFAPQLGLDPAELQSARAHFDQDPKGFLAFVNAQAKKQLQIVNRGNGGYDVVDMVTGNPTRSVAPQYKPEYRTVGEGQSLVEVGGDTAAPAPQAPGDWLSGVSQAAPDAQVTSGLRTQADQERLRRQGYHPAENSKHLSGQAVDLVPRPGETMAQLYARVSKAPGVKAINEGDHVHVQAQAQGGVRVVAQGAPKQASIPSGYKANADGSLSFIPGGPADPATKTSAGLKPIPAKIQQGYADNAKGMTQIDQAIATIKANPGALGGSAYGYIRNKLGNDVSQRADPGGVSTRAALANIGSLLIHDRSGAAVTAAETPRLLPFIPQVTDTPEAAIKKLQGLKDQYRNANDQIEVQFGEESGYRPLGSSTAPKGRAAAPNPRAAGGLPPASALKANHITTFANGQRWTLRDGKPARVQ